MKTDPVICPAPRPPPGESLRQFLCWLLAFFLIVFGAQGWIAWLYGSPLPYWDQWGEAVNVLQPWQNGRWQWTDLLAPSNDHRPVLTYLWDLGLIQLNGRWDTLAQMLADDFLHAGYAAGLAASLWHFGGRRNGGLICAFLLPFFTLPFAGENEIWGYMSQWYFIQCFGLATIVGLGFFRAGSRGWWLGAGAGVLGLLSMASGPLAPLATGGLCVLRAGKQRRWPPGGWPTLAVCLTLAVAGFMLRAPGSGSQRFHAHSGAEFSAALLRHLAWPYFQEPWMALVILLPLAGLLALYLRPRETPTAAVELTLTLALWSLAGAAALAYGRANYGDGIPASRYTEVFSLLVTASVFATRLLAARWPQGPLAAWHGVLPLILVSSMAWGMWKMSDLVVSQLLTEARLTNLMCEERVESYATTQDAKAFLERPFVPPDPHLVLGVLSDPRLQPILPQVCVPPATVKTSGPLTAITNWILPETPKLVILGGALFAGLFVYGLARRTLGLTAQKPEELFVLAALLGGLWLACILLPLRREVVEYRLEAHLAFQLNLSGYPERAAIHQRRAEGLKHRWSLNSTRQP